MAEKDIVWKCSVCNKIPTRQSARRCPFCRGKMVPWDRSKDPIERQPDWPRKVSKERDSVQDNNRIAYSEFYEKAKRERE